MLAFFSLGAFKLMLILLPIFILPLLGLLSGVNPHLKLHCIALVYLCGGTSGIVWTARLSLLSSKTIENEENSG